MITRSEFVSTLKNKFEPYKTSLLKSMGIEPVDTRSDAEKAKDFLKEEFDNACVEYRRAIAYYNEANVESIDYAIQNLNACKSKLDCILKQMKGLEA